MNMDNQPPIQQSTSSNNKLGTVLAIVAILVGLAAIGLGLSGQFSEDTSDLQSKADDNATQLAEFKGTLEAVEQQNGFSVNDAVNKDGYQAVFLTSGQVYFGKLEDGEPGQVKLTDIYYLQGAEYEEGGQIAGGSEAQISLAKLGNELHGPEDTMHISRDNLEFWENLKEDGQVVTAIREFQNN